MSELIIEMHIHGNLRRKLLATASLAVLVGPVCATNVLAEDAGGHPTVWIELGGQLERVSRSEDQFAPSFSLRMPRPDFETVSPLSFVRPPRYSVGGEAKLSLEPAGMDWVFTAAVRYGRSNGKKHFHNQTYGLQQVGERTSLVSPLRFEDVKTGYEESHTILDFAAGRDVGLGFLGDAVANIGVRYAQFASTSAISLSSKPDIFTKLGTIKALGKYYTIHRTGFHVYQGALEAKRSFHGVGPSLSFSGATKLLGNSEGSLSLDWGMNGALLFGRQRTNISNETHASYYHATNNPGLRPQYNRTNHRNDPRSVTVPNLGGFAGLSAHYPNAKVSFGYRADLFFGAMDGGIDVRKTYDRSFYGPYATISIGLGG